MDIRWYLGGGGHYVQAHMFYNICNSLVQFKLNQLFCPKSSTLTCSCHALRRRTASSYCDCMLQYYRAGICHPALAMVANRSQSRDHLQYNV
jgi:hypothetical protein